MCDLLRRASSCASCELLALTLLAVGCGSGDALEVEGGFPVLPLGDTYFDCDTPAGNFSSWSQRVQEGSGAMTGSLYFHTSRPSSEWASFVRVAVGDEDRNRTGFELVSTSRSDLRATWVSLEVDREQELLDAHRFPMQQSIEFRLRWDVDGSLEVTLGQQKHTSSHVAPLASTRVWLECGSAWATFYDVAIRDPSQDEDAGS